jgi:hypothetical protein
MHAAWRTGAVHAAVADGGELDRVDDGLDARRVLDERDHHARRAVLFWRIYR